MTNEPTATKRQPVTAPRELGLERLSKLAAFLRTLKPGLFDYSTITDRFDEAAAPATLTTGVIDGKVCNFWERADEDCGSTACALGWAPAVFNDELVWCKGAVALREHVVPVVTMSGKPIMELDRDVYRNWTDYDGSVITANLFFGITHEEVKYLFNYESWFNDVTDDYDWDEYDVEGEPDANLEFSADPTAVDLANHIDRFVKEGGIYTAASPN